MNKPLKAKVKQMKKLIKAANHDGYDQGFSDGWADARKNHASVYDQGWMDSRDYSEKLIASFAADAVMALTGLMSFIERNYGGNHIITDGDISTMRKMTFAEIRAIAKRIEVAHETHGAPTQTETDDAVGQLISEFKSRCAGFDVRGAVPGKPFMVPADRVGEFYNPEFKASLDTEDRVKCGHCNVGYEREMAETHFVYCPDCGARFDACEID